MTTVAERMNPFFRREVVLVSPLPAAECEARLRLDLLPFTEVWSVPRGMGGRVHGGRFAVRHANPRGHRLDSEVRGTFVPEPGGTRIALELRWSTYSRIGLVLMLLLCVVFPLWMKESVAAFPVTFVVVLPAAFVFGVFWGRWLARGDDDWLVERLAELFDAVVAHASA